MFNRVILIGNLTKDPDVRYTPGGTPVTTLSIAVNSRYKQGDESKEEVLFIDAVVFGKQAETCGQYLAKGRPVLVEGRLRERRWEYEGQKKSKMEIVANNVRFLSSRKESSSPGQGFGEIPPPEEVTDLEPF
ncbi:MAG: single-stranded DNA-binding protein [Alphaproteobacteria bacterium]|uniref:Single-stranded DNA-binding protein n=1 Tax=Candidatus Nitrobium versatile TaxID=2884831 RepID=A0A953M1D5_9BACT|nr:single-stranded DNA-binding protein [Candidatus Nitrobium versatile]